MLTLHFHPLSSYCHKALIALYENGTSFTPLKVDLGDPDSRAAFAALWPIAKFPVLQDDARSRTLPESTIIIEYLDRHYRGRTRFIPEDDELALRVRERDRFCDLYIHTPLQKIIADQIRPPDAKDPHGVEEAYRMLRTAFGMLEAAIPDDGWAFGTFTLADCAAAPPLFYINEFLPLDEGYPRLARYLARLKQRPSYARVLEEAAPYMNFFPNPRNAGAPAA